ncbi:hypothetical protein [Streptomyces violascens]
MTGGLVTPILITAHDLAPQYASAHALYPYPKRPLAMDDVLDPPG